MTSSSLRLAWQRGRLRASRCVVGRGDTGRAGYDLQITIIDHTSPTIFIYQVLLWLSARDMTYSAGIIYIIISVTAQLLSCGTIGTWRDLAIGFGRSTVLFS